MVLLRLVTIPTTEVTCIFYSHWLCSIGECGTVSPAGFQVYYNIVILTYKAYLLTFKTVPTPKIRQLCLVIMHYSAHSQFTFRL